MIRIALFALLALGLFPPASVQAQSLTEIRTQLQATLQRSLSRSMMEGALPHLDLMTGKLTRFYPTENHEIILRIADVYVMCATLVDDDGTEATVDYYMTHNGSGYSLIRTEINNRAPLLALMKSGKAIRLE
ncbi:hypothetical protein SAMN05443999_10837 [Roseovarius azorensis]|uniref:Uncharacterized protein n=1 Tax=Roseovarius azorensis TaxID=1287727 RepID=A0A1H7T1W8_9RHOB|nr:hypothetical protein [Roseovarius azorensis]SEL78871.1 hypothetical protein SAMN05443999_10837 [Roseovarius azorensis]